MRKKKIQEVSVSKKISKLLINFFEQEPKDKPYLRLANNSIGSNSILRILERNENKCFVNMDNEYFIVDMKNKEVKGYGSLFETDFKTSDILELMK